MHFILRVFKPEVKMNRLSFAIQHISINHVFLLPFLFFRIFSLGQTVFKSTFSIFSEQALLPCLLSLRFHGLRQTSQTHYLHRPSNRSIRRLLWHSAIPDSASAHPDDPNSIPVVLITQIKTPENEKKFRFFLNFECIAL